MAGRIALVVVAASLALPASARAPGALPLPEPAYYRPVVDDGMAFPIARASWLSVIEFGDDWHDPRFRLIDGRWRLIGVHEGTDIIAEEGTPILAMASGRIEQLGWTFYSGTRVGVRGEDGRYYFYAHLSAIEPGLGVGVAVAAGQPLGSVGNTGYGPPGHTGEFPPHLHLGIRDGDTWVNPYPTVRSLYRHAARVTAQGERRIARLALAGDARALERVVTRLYAEG